MKLHGRLKYCLAAVVGGCTALLAGCAPPGQGLPPLQTVPWVDLQRYAGTWYEIASYRHRFQQGCVATRATYTLREDGRISVLNECRQRTLDGPSRSVEGTARVVDPQTNARLEVTFFWPFWGDYWIIDLDAGYRWAVVGHPSRRYLWVLSRSRTLDDAVYRAILGRLPGQGYDPARLSRTPQSAEPPAVGL